MKSIRAYFALFLVVAGIVHAQPALNTPIIWEFGQPQPDMSMPVATAKIRVELRGGDGGQR
jgi:hypothetical protein